MYVKVKVPGKVFYDFEQKVNISDRITEVKTTSLIREFIRTGSLIEVEKPSDAVLKKYADEDIEIKSRKEKAASKTAKPLDARLKAANAKIVTMSSELSDAEEANSVLAEQVVTANNKIALLEEANGNLVGELQKVGDPKSKEDLAKAKTDATSQKKETASKDRDK